MNLYYDLRFPGFRRKALTLSYDDGTVHDARLVEILNRYGVKATFNLNSVYFTRQELRQTRKTLTRAEAIALFADSGHEVAVHSYSHPFLEQLPQGNAAWELMQDRKILEEMFGCIIRGMAYPMGTYNDAVVEAARSCGICYARTCSATHGFDLPEDWLRLHPTCHHNDPALMELCQRFLRVHEDRPWDPRPKLFYLWGHSYEFSDDNNWERIEDFCARVAGNPDIWFATNGEIYEYTEAARRIAASMDGQLLYNPSALTLYLEASGKRLLLEPGKTLKLSESRRDAGEAPMP